VQAVGRELRLLVPGEFAVAGGVDADAVAAEEFRGIEPLQVILDRLRARRFLAARRGLPSPSTMMSRLFTPSPAARFFISPR
jgi:hypothetical protein